MVGHQDPKHLDTSGHKDQFLERDGNSATLPPGSHMWLALGDPGVGIEGAFLCGSLLLLPEGHNLPIGFAVPAELAAGLGIALLLLLALF
jgi:hypothetical protein